MVVILTNKATYETYAAVLSSYQDESGYFVIKWRNVLHFVERSTSFCGEEYLKFEVLLVQVYYK